MTGMARIGDLARRWTPSEADTTVHETVEEVERRVAWRDFAPARFADADVSGLEGSAKDAIEEWRQNPTRNLVLLGPVGTGKTYAAMAAARLALDRGWNVRFHPVIELLDRIRPGGDDRTLDVAAGCHLLVLDDLGGERPSEWTAERLYLICNRRWLEQRPTVVTSNLDAADGQGPLVDAVGARLYSRLVDGAVVARLAGPDRRRS